MATEYFPHDYHARHHPALLSLRRQHGLAGLGAFWCLVEYLYEQGGDIPQSHLPDLAYDLRCEEQLLVSIIDDFGLFQCNEQGLIICEAVNERLAIRKQKAEKAVKSARARWTDANAMRTHSERSANAMLLKESKEKENKIPPLTTTYAATAAVDSNTQLDQPKKKGSTQGPADFAPTGLTAALLQRDDVAQAWEAFLANRRRQKAPCTPYALQLIIGKLRTLRGDDGAGWAELLNAAVERGWRSVFEIDSQLKTRNHDHRPQSAKPTLAERYNDAARNLLTGI